MGQALAESGISLQDLDYTVPAEDQPVPANGTIRVVAVTDDVKVNQITSPFQTEYTVDSSVELDTTKVIVAGQYGLATFRYPFQTSGRRGGKGRKGCIENS